MKNICLILFFSLYTCLHAQEALTLTYADAVNVALDKSYTIKSYQETLRATEFSYLYYKAMFKPRLDLSLYTPSWNESITAVNQANGLPVYNSLSTIQFGGNLKFTYVLPTGGNLALYSNLYREDYSTVLAEENYKKLNTSYAYSRFGVSFDQPIFTKNTLRENLREAELQYQKTTSEFSRQQMNIIYNVTQGFYYLYRVTREMEISGDKLKNSEEAYRIAMLKAQTGRIPEGDLLIAEVEVAQNKAKLSENTGKLERAKDEFKQLIGLDIFKEIRIVTDIRYDTFYVDMEKAIEEGLKNRLELSESDIDIRLSEIQLDRAKREREVKGSISAYYDISGISTNDENNTYQLFQSSFDNFVDRPPNRGVSLNFTIPILDWGRGRSKVQRAKAELNSSKLSLENARMSIIREIRDIVRTVEESRNRLEINAKNQQVAEKSYQVSLLRFGNGDITSQQLATEQERLSDIQLAYLDSYITYQLAVNDLKRKTMWDFQNNRSYLRVTGVAGDQKPIGK